MAAVHLRSDVAQRIEILTQVVAVPSIGEMARANWLLDHRRPSEAREVLLRAAENLQGWIPTPALQSLLHRAEVDTAVSAISRQGQCPVRRNGPSCSCAASRSTHGRVSAGVIHASVLAVNGQARAAEAELRQAFSKWVEAQNSAMKPLIPENEMARDAMAIRDLLFDPDGVYQVGENQHFIRPTRRPHSS